MITPIQKENSIQVVRLLEGYQNDAPVKSAFRKALTEVLENLAAEKQFISKLFCLEVLNDDVNDITEEHKTRVARRNHIAREISTRWKIKELMEAIIATEEFHLIEPLLKKVEKILQREQASPQPANDISTPDSGKTEKDQFGGDDDWWPGPEKWSPASVYDLKGRSGALIVNNLFKGRGEYERTEYAADHASKLKEMFMKLNFHNNDITVEENLDSEKFENTIKAFRQKAEKMSSIFIVIGTHGGPGTNSLRMEDGKPVDLYDDIRSKFAESPKFKNVPKIILIQACMTGTKQPDTDRKTDGMTLGQTKDVIMVLSTLPNSVAKGNLFIPLLIDEFTEHAAKKSLREMLVEVNDKMTAKVGQQLELRLDPEAKDYRFKLK